MRLAAQLRRFGSAEGGTAAIEMGLIGMMFFGALINAVEIGRYGVSQMQVNNAAQAGVAAAYRTCDGAHLPATSNCQDLLPAVKTAVTSTSLGTSIQPGAKFSEGWYCINSAKQLQLVASATSAKPADCSAAQSPGLSPGLYLGVQAQYDYKPIFTGLTLAGSFATPITRTAWARMQ
jgi:hypothetical protein